MVLRAMDTDWIPTIASHQLSTLPTVLLTVARNTHSRPFPLTGPSFHSLNKSPPLIWQSSPANRLSSPPVSSRFLPPSEAYARYNRRSVALAPCDGFHPQHKSQNVYLQDSSSITDKNRGPSRPTPTAPFLADRYEYPLKEGFEEKSCYLSRKGRASSIPLFDARIVFFWIHDE